MPDLAELLVRNSEIQPGVINAAQLRHPELGLIESIIQLQGQVQSRLIQLIAKNLKLELLDPKQAHEIDESLLEAGGETLQRLIVRLKALPISCSGNPPQRVLRLAMVDPADDYAKRVFADFFGCSIEVVVARETELFDALKYKLAGSTKVENHVDRLRRQPVPQWTGTHAINGGHPEAQPHIQAIVEAAVNYGATRVEVEFKPNLLTVTMVASESKVQGFEVHASPEAFTAALFSDAFVAIDKDGRPYGSIRTQAGNAVFEARFTFEHTFRNRRGVDGKALVLSNLSINPNKHLDFWASSPAPVSEELGHAIESYPGIYVGVFTQNDAFQRTAAALAGRYPDFVFLNTFEQLANNPLLLNQLDKVRIFIPHRAKGVPEAVQDLLGLPDAIRARIAGIMAHQRIPRACPLCREECVPTQASASIYPAQLQQSLTKHMYPRGCPVCNSTGYLGTLGLTSLLMGSSPAGQLFARKQPAQAIWQQMQKDGFTSPAHSIIHEAVAGNTTIEAAVKSFSENANFPPERYTAKGRQIIRKGKPVEDSGDPTQHSPLQLAPKSGKMDSFHSVVLELGQDASDMRRALLAEEAANAAKAEAAKPKGPPKSGNQFHSVVLDLGQDAKDMRQSLLEEERAKALGFEPGQLPSSSATAPKKPNASGNPYHSMVIGMDDDLADMRKKLRDEGEG